MSEAPQEEHDPTPIRPIREIYAENRERGRPVVSIELFPPKTAQSHESLVERALPRLATAEPDFISVTYGAGGSTHDKTLEVVDHVQREYGITGMAHLTCVSSTRVQIERYLEDAERLGIRNILALRGDLPVDDPQFVKPDNGFDFSYQLVDFIKAKGGGSFSIGAAGFPESHTDSGGKHVDWQRLKNKIDHGVDFVLTQLFFNNADYFELLEYMTGLGVTVPITPGILPILNTGQVKRFTAVCGATLPDHLVTRLEAFGDDEEAVRAFGVEFATQQCEELLAGGAPGLHLYSLNRSPSCLEILRNLSLASR